MIMNLNEPLLTDLYQLTMAQGYWECGKENTQACFHMFFRDYPFNGGYAVACGMAQLADIVDGFSFSEDDLEYLSSIPAPGGGMLFKREFIDYLRDFSLSVDIDAVAEGEIVRAPCAGGRAHHGMPASGNSAFELREFRDPHRHEGGTRLHGGRSARSRIRFAPCAGRGRRRVGLTRRSCGWMRLHIQRLGRKAVRFAGIGHACPFMGHVVSR